MDDLASKFGGMFGYPQLPTKELMAEQQEHRRKALDQQAKRELLQEQMSRAEAVRNKPRTANNWIDALSNVASFAGGNANVRRTQGQQEDNASALASSTAAAQEAEVQRANRQEQFNQAKQFQQYTTALKDREARGEIAEGRLAAARAAAATKRQEKLADREPAGTFIREDDVTMTPIKGGWDGAKNKWVGTDGKEYDDAEIKKYGELGLSDKFDRELSRTSGQKLKTTYEFMDLGVDEWDRIGSPMKGLPTEILQKFFIDGEKQGIWDWMQDEDRGGTINKVGDWVPSEELQYSVGMMNKMRALVIMPYREENTSGPLSDRDVQEFTDTILMQHGAPGAMLYESAQNLLGNREAFLRSALEGWETHGDREAYTSSKRGFNIMRPDGWKGVQDKARYRGDNPFTPRQFDAAQRSYDRTREILEEFGPGTPTGDAALEQRDRAARYLGEYPQDYTDWYQRTHP